MKHYLTLLDAFEDQARLGSRGITYISGDTVEEYQSYTQLKSESLLVLRELQAAGMCAGDELLMQVDDNRSFLNIFWGCLLGGIIPVPVTVGNNDEHRMKLFKIWNTLNRPYLITDPKVFSNLEKYAVQQGLDATYQQIAHRTLFTDALDYNNLDQGLPVQVQPEDLAFIQFSSGSTGDPKGVMLTHENLIYNTRDIANGTQLDENKAYLGWMPLTHDMGLIAFHLTCLVSNATQYIMPTALFIRRPTLWLKKSSEHRVTHICSPNFGYKFFLAQYKPENALEWDLSTIEMIQNGAEPISIELCHVFLEAMSKHHLKKSSMIAVYGMAEASVGVSHPPITEELTPIHLHRDQLNIGEAVVEVDYNDSNRISFADVGYALESCEIRISDQDHQPIPDRHIGHIHIRGKNVTRGYYNNPTATAKVLTPDGWLVTGDLGFMYKGRLVITGRAKDIIFVNGQNVYPHDVERVAEEVEGIELGKVAVCGVYDESIQQDRMIVFVMHVKQSIDFAPIAHRLKSHLNYRAGWQVHEVLPIRRIPKTTSGKVQRFKLAEDYAQGVFANVVTQSVQSATVSTDSIAEIETSLPLTSFKDSISKLPKQAEIERQLVEICQQILNKTTIGVHDSYFDIGVSSLQMVQIVDQLEERFDVKVEVTDFFSYPTIARLAHYLIHGEEKAFATHKPAINQSSSVQSKDIAIIGMDGTFPQAKTLEQFWSNIAEGTDCIGSYNEQRKADAQFFISQLNTEGRSHQLADGGYLDEVDKFDYSFFKLTPREASLMDPNQRLFLQTAWSTIENAGYGGNILSGRKVGVYVGFSKTSFEYERLLSEVTPASIPNFAIGNLSSIIPSRISYLLNLKGPAVTIDTACSSSLVAVHMACKAIQHGECEMALAGGVKTILLPLKAGLGMESSDDRARAFDDSSDGTGWGEGVGAVFLKSLEQAERDGDHILAVIKGSAINQDGSTVGISAPNAIAQAEVITEAWEDAGVDPETISYIEAHGTGTRLGDPVEIEGISRAFRAYTSRKQFCAISTVKSNIGHLYEAAGIAGLIKSVLSLQHQQLAPLVHFRTPNQQISFEQSPVYVNRQLQPWVTTDGVPRRSGLSSFGFSGTNCHMVLEEYTQLHETIPTETTIDPLILTLSARTEKALQQLIKQYIACLQLPEMAHRVHEVCYTANTGRSHWHYRVAIVAKSSAELMSRLMQLHQQGITAPGIFAGKVELLQTSASMYQGNLDTLIALEQLAEQYVQGADIAWHDLYSSKEYRRVPLPTYPFERKRCWIEAPTPTVLLSPRLNHEHQSQEVVSLPDNHESTMLTIKESKNTVKDVVRQTITQMISNVSQLTTEELEADTHFLEMGLDSINLSQVRHSIKDTFHLDIPMSEFFESLTNLNVLTAYIADVLPQEAIDSLTGTTHEVVINTSSTNHEINVEIETSSSLQTVTTDVQHHTFNNNLISNNTTSETNASYSSVERIMAQQLQLMSYQLEVLHGKATPNADVQSNHSTYTAIPDSIVEQPTAVSVVSTSSPVTINQESKPFVAYKPLELQTDYSLPERQSNHIQQLIQKYTQRTASTKQYTQQYRSVYANNRNIAGFRPLLKEMVYQIVSQRAEGSKLWDLDHNEYVDITMGFGVNFFGHNPQFIREKIEAELQQGMCVGPMSNMAGQVAEAITRMTGTERISLYNSGTEAIMVALRLARAATGRSKVVIFAGSYHGTFDGILALGSAGVDKEHSTPLAPGVLQHMVDDIVVLNYGTQQALDYIEANGHELAAVLVEPVQSRRPDFQPKAFLQQIRELTRRSDTAFIFDEVITGFRIHPGGAQAIFDIQADLVTYGKVIGGGMPIGIVAGTAKYMDGVDGGTWDFGDESYPAHEHRRTFVAGTFCHHPLAMAASLAVLHRMEEEGPALQANLNARTAQFASELNAFFENEQLPMKIVHFGSLFRFVLKGDLELFYYHMLDKGIYIWEGRNCFLSTVHTEEDIARIVQAVKDSVQELRAGGFLPDGPPDPDHDPDKLPVPQPIHQSLTHDKIIPLTADQKQLWFASSSGKTEAQSLHETAILRFQGELNMNFLKEAVHMVMQRHEALRTYMSHDGENQIVASQMELLIPVFDFTMYDSTDKEQKIKSWLQEQQQLSFSMTSTEPLFRIQCLQLTEYEYIAVFTFHHLIADGWSIGVCIQELEQIYSALIHNKPVRLPESVPFQQYVVWQQQQLNHSNSQEAVAYWNHHFRRILPVVELPSIYRGTLLPSVQGGRYTAMLSSELVQKLRATSMELGTTLFVTLLTAFKCVLHRLTEQSIVTVGVPTAGQTHMEAYALIGNCVNLLPIITEITKDISFATYADQVKQKMKEIEKYQMYSFASLAERGIGNLPVINTVFNMDRAVPELQFDGLITELMTHDIHYSKYELFMNVTPIGKELSIEMDYNADLFSQAVIKEWTVGFITFLENMVANIQAPMREHSLLSVSNYQQLDEFWTSLADPQGHFPYVLDMYGQPVVAGAIGELYVGQLYSTNYDSQSLQADQHLTTLQRTGQLVYWGIDKRIQYIGDIDRVQTIRGHRVYLEQIEKYMANTFSLQKCIVLPVVASNRDSDQYQLCAYLQMDQTQHEFYNPEQIRQMMNEQIPDYMQPRILIPMSNISLLENGQPDLAMLPDPVQQGITLTSLQTTHHSIESENDTGYKLIQIWQDVLGINDIQRTDNFFQLGGDSLKATVILSRINKEFAIHIPLREIFNLQTINEIVQYIEGGEHIIYLPIESVESQEFYPVSSAQKRMYIMEQIGNGGLAYHVSGQLTIQGPLNTERLIKALQQVVARHESFRTSLEWHQDQVIQRVHPHVLMDINTTYVQEHQLSEMRQAFVQPFQLDQSPLFRAQLLQWSDSYYALLVDMHHAIADGFSMAILLEELVHSYQGIWLPEPNIHYKDVVMWQQQQIAEGILQTQQAYWLNTLSGDLPVLNLPTDYIRPQTQQFAGHTLSFAIDKLLTEKLYVLAGQTETTLYMVLLTAYEILLSKYSGQNDIIIGTPVAGRRHADTESVIGMFVNTLALRVQPQPSQNFRQLLEEVKQISLNAFEHQEYPFEELVEHLEGVRDLSRNPVFDTLFSLQNTGTDMLTAGEVTFIPEEFNAGIAKLDLSLYMTEQKDQLSCTWEYATSLFKQDTIEQIHRHFVQILQLAVDHVDLTLEELDVMTDTEKQMVLQDFNHTKLNFPDNQTIHSQWESQVKLTPDSIALVCNTQSITYKQLNERANQLAYTLVQHGAGCDRLIGIMVDRSIEMVVGLLAILKSGSAYVPIDPEYPTGRIEYMLEHSEASILVTSRHLLKELNYTGAVVYVEDQASYHTHTTNLELPIHSENLAYVIYTSGSTGQPKGVMLQHRSVMNFITGMKQVIPFTTDKVMLSLTTMSFDIFVLETILPLLEGMKVVIGERHHQADPIALAELISTHHIDMLQMTPSRLQMLLHVEQGIQALHHVKDIMVGGEALPHQLLQQLQDIQGLRIFNMYGPTETTVWSAVKELTTSPTISIGKPIANTQLYIVDSAMRIQPLGVAGELCIAGEGLARGYWKRQDLTDEKFVANPFVLGERMYRTGDLARWQTNGEIEFIGRIDYQVKVKGFRIELGEVEHCLTAIEGIQEAVVIVQTNHQQEPMICAYLIQSQEKEYTGAEIRQYAAKQLPYYAVPSHYTFIDQMPLTPNGKTDRKALPEPEEWHVTHTDYQAPENELEWLIAQIWQDILKREWVGVHDNFFMLGGDSIKAIQVIARLREQHYELDIKSLFEHPSIRELIYHVKSTAPHIDQSFITGEAILSPGQYAWLKQHPDLSIPYHHSVLLHANQKWEEQAISVVMQQLIEHHDALRLAYVPVNSETTENHEKANRQNQHPQGKWIYQNPEATTFSLEISSTINSTLDDNAYQSFSVLEKEYAYMQQERKRICQQIVPGEGPLIRLVIFNTSSGDYLLIAAHEMLLDEVSWSILLEDLALAYSQYITEQSVQLPDKTIAYQTWNQQLEHQLAVSNWQPQIQYWKQIKPHFHKDLFSMLPTNETIWHQMNRITLKCSLEKTNQLITDVHHIYGTNTQEVLFAAFGQALKATLYQNEQVISIDMKTTGREMLFAENTQIWDATLTIGHFNSMYPLVFTIESDDLSVVLKQAKELVRQVPDNGISYAMLRYMEDVLPEHHTPISFHYREERNKKYINFEAEWLHDLNDVASVHDLVMNASIEDEQLTICLDYDTQQYSSTDIEFVLQHFEQILFAMIDHCIHKEERELTPTDVGAQDIDLEDFEDIQQFYENV
ncbi:iturin family lipopeptide synthetase A [Paenibacillus sp. SORGH_AS306]|uniref:non-ribosomal peptide synthetase n=1 Tax=unclassified Paenibacillus TaxID=185978 RepID=UPI002781CD70|nr:MULTISPECIES: non-ribosomal peptide synthetase [unclassified Paenibacillus]MDQ1234060.1 iturin family lipopeptide synthetase A [Paenibacillus sp. SORGH_AS_0306]MDR6111105.1 iturin family lipopeptide synthetase A [Paenibacillus sp. SORGH_AS_0338]